MCAVLVTPSPPPEGRRIRFEDLGGLQEGVNFVPFRITRDEKISIRFFDNAIRTRVDNICWR